MEYASKAVGNAALATGIIGTAGTALGAVAGAGGLVGLLGGRPNPPVDPGDRPVTRFEMGLYQEINAKNDENVLLKGQIYADNGDKALQAQISEQAVWNATQTGILKCLQGQVAQLQSITQMMIPNANIAPGWGGVVVEPTAAVKAAAAATGTGS